LPDQAGLDPVDGGEDRRHKRPQILHAVGRSNNDHNTERQCRDALLKLDTAVHCDEGIMVTAHSTQQLAVLDPSPPATGHGVYGMSVEFRSSSSRRIGREGFAREVE
jgi:hypothetical protein